MKNIINTRKRKIIVLSSVSVLLVIIIVSIVVGIQNKSIPNPNPTENQKNIVVNHAEYKGGFSYENSKQRIDLSKLLIPNTKLNLVGKTLTLTKGSLLWDDGRYSPQFKGSLLKGIDIHVNNSAGYFTFTIIESSKKEFINLTPINSEFYFNYDLFLSW